MELDQADRQYFFRVFMLNMTADVDRDNERSIIAPQIRESQSPKDVTKVLNVMLLRCPLNQL